MTPSTIGHSVHSTVANTTTGAAYTDGTGAFHPREERIERGSAINGERRIKVDVCVIGSGAGGAQEHRQHHGRSDQGRLRYQGGKIGSIGQYRRVRDLVEKISDHDAMVMTSSQ